MDGYRVYRALGPLAGGNPVLDSNPLPTRLAAHGSCNTYGILPAVHITWASVKRHALAESWNLVVTEFLA
jgi:hypothetical protein